MTGKVIDIPTKTGTGFSGYLSLPDNDADHKGTGPGLILIQEIFGVNSHIRDVANLYAAAGFVVLAPDLFWRVQPHIELSYTPDDMQKGRGLAQRLNEEQVLADLGDAKEALKKMPQCNGKIAVVGYCLGGHYAFRMATHDLVDVAVGYYGNLDTVIDESKNLHCPLMLHYGEKDKHITMDSVNKYKDVLKGKGHFEIFVYDADHGFNCDQRPSYDRKSAMLAFGRTMVLLNRALA